MYGFQNQRPREEGLLSSFAMRLQHMRIIQGWESRVDVDEEICSLELRANLGDSRAFVIDGPCQNTASAAFPQGLPYSRYLLTQA